MHNKLSSIVFLFALTVVSFSPSRAAEPEIYILSTSTDAPYVNDSGTGFQDLVIQEMFNRIGLKARVESYDASSRALTNANIGIDHGVSMRIKGLNKKFTNLVRIEEPLISNEFVAYSRDLHIVTDSWVSLENHLVGYIHGWQIFQNNMTEGTQKNSVKTAEQMFRMLDLGRIDIALYERWQGLELARKSNMKVLVHEPPLATVDMYPFMHKDYAHLVPKLTQALRDMKADGGYQKIYETSFGYLQQEHHD